MSVTPTAPGDVTVSYRAFCGSLESPSSGTLTFTA
jgi:hypothetical protein